MKESNLSATTIIIRFSRIHQNPLQKKVSVSLPNGIELPTSFTRNIDSSISDLIKIIRAECQIVHPSLYVPMRDPLFQFVLQARALLLDLMFFETIQSSSPSNDNFGQILELFF